jgi:mannose-6-phosphate isomerase-like protein (cupin superfamily)
MHKNKRMTMASRTAKSLAALAAGALLASGALAQQAGGGGGDARPAPRQWWVEKTQGGVYPAPMRPIWRLADLKAMHPGQNNWQQQIIKDPEQEATYNSAAPGSKFGQRIHPDTPSLFVVIAGTMDFQIEGQQPVHARRGSLVNIMKTTVFSYEVTGSENALWVEVNPRNYQTLFPTSEPQPKAVKGGKVVKVAFPARPGAYAKPNQPHWNLFDGIAACEPAGARVVDDHIWSSPLLGYVNPADNKCPVANPRGNVGNAPMPGAPPLPAFNPRTTFGHLHSGPAEWWIVQVGQISGKFENQGEFIASEGDVLYAAPMTWHQMRAVAPSGPSVRLAMGGYELINMNNTEGGGN